MTESKLGRKGFIWLTASYHSPPSKEIRPGAPDRTSEAGTEAEAEGVLSTGLHLGASSACFLIQPMAASPGSLISDGTTLCQI